MTAFLAGLFRQFTVGSRPSINVPRQGPLRVEALEPRHQCAVEVTQDCNIIVIDGEPDAGSLDIHHEPGATGHGYQDKIVVTWTSGGERQTKAFDLYRYVERKGQRWAVKNIEYVEFSGGRGRNKYWSQAKIATYLHTSPQSPELLAAIYGDGEESLWSGAIPARDAEPA